MKRFCLAIIFLSLGLVYGQNVISLTFQPTDLGYGLRYDRLLRDYGFYSSISHGSYKFDDKYIKNHYKAAIGVTIPIDDSYVSAGINAHNYRGVCGTFGKALDPVSFELGAGVLLGRFNVAFRMDFLKGEGCIDFGIKL